MWHATRSSVGLTEQKASVHRAAVVLFADDILHPLAVRVGPLGMERLRICSTQPHAGAIVLFWQRDNPQRWVSRTDPFHHDVHLIALPHGFAADLPAHIAATRMLGRGRRTLLLRCADCVDARFAAAVLAVHGRAERVPVEAALVGSAEALRVQRAIDAASEGGGG